MPYTTVVPSTTITAAWGNANVRDQVVSPFASAAARTSAITAPVEGMLSTLTDVDGLDYYDGTAWRPPNVLFIRKTVDNVASVALSTTLVDDETLVLTVAANAVYEVRGSVIYTAATTCDFKIGWSGPASATFDWTIGGPGSNQDSTTGIPYNGVNTIGGTDTVGGVSPSTSIVARPSGILVTSGTSGTFKLRWAQGTSDANGVKTKAGSYLLLTRVG